MDVICDYCGEPAELVDDVEVYGRSYGGKLWICKPCRAWVGCHKNSKKHKPMGRLANLELRAMRQKAHDAFDPTWTDNKVDDRNAATVRKNAYAWLAARMNIPYSKCHIGQFNYEQCEEVINICNNTRGKENGDT